MGRFIQADTIIPGAGDSKSYDRYAYVNNNPMKYTDPSGHRFDPESGAGAYVPYVPGKNRGWSLLQTNIFKPVPIPTKKNILFSGSYGYKSAHLDGPDPEGQMGVWWSTDFYKGSQQYHGSIGCDDEYKVCKKYAKFNTVEQAFSEFSNEQMVSLTCYSGGVEACIMFAEMYMEAGGVIYSMALIGGTYEANDEGGTLQTMNFWSSKLQHFVDKGVNLLVYDDLVGDPPQHHGTLSIHATFGSYQEISSPRSHWNNKGDWASNMSPDLAERVTNWHNTLDFDTGYFDMEGYPPESE